MHDVCYSYRLSGTGMPKHGNRHSDWQRGKHITHPLVVTHRHPPTHPRHPPVFPHPHEVVTILTHNPLSNNHTILVELPLDPRRFYVCALVIGHWSLVIDGMSRTYASCTYPSLSCIHRHEFHISYSHRVAYSHTHISYHYSHIHMSIVHMLLRNAVYERI